jgi:predicted component of type VI protein secretion system
MKNFGLLKGKMLKKITDSFASNNKNEVKDILKTIKENRDLKELYLLYEDIENKQFDDSEVAKLYVDELSSMLKKVNIEESKYGTGKLLNELNSILKDVQPEENQIYNILDVLSENDSLLNIDKKVMAKKKLVDFLMTKKQVSENEEIGFTKNENVLLAVLTNNFNTLFNDSLNEEEKNELKTILSLNEGEIKTKITELKESVLNDVNSLLNESTTDSELTGKLTDVKNEIDKMSNSKYNFYRLTQLKNGLK